MLGRKFHSPFVPSSLFFFFSSHLPSSLTHPLSCFLTLTIGAVVHGPQEWKYRALVKMPPPHVAPRGQHATILTSAHRPKAWLHSSEHRAGHWWHRTGNLFDNPENQNLNLQRSAERGERTNTSLAETRTERTHPAAQFPASASTGIYLSFSWWCWFVKEEKKIRKQTFHIHLTQTHLP